MSADLPSLLAGLGAVAVGSWGYWVTSRLLGHRCCDCKAVNR